MSSSSIAFVLSCHHELNTFKVYFVEILLHLYINPNIKFIKVKTFLYSELRDENFPILKYKFGDNFSNSVWYCFIRRKYTNIHFVRKTNYNGIKKVALDSFLNTGFSTYFVIRHITTFQIRHTQHYIQIIILSFWLRNKYKIHPAWFS